MINQEKGIVGQTPPFSNKKRKLLASVMFIFVFAVAIGLYTGKINPFNAENSNPKVYEFAAVPGGVPFKYDFAPELIPLIKPEGSAPYSFYLGSGVGFPPMGLKLDMNGVLKGIPTGTGISKFEVCVKDVVGRSACKMYSMLVSPKTTPNKNSASNGGKTSNEPADNNIVPVVNTATKAVAVNYEGTYRGDFKYTYVPPCLIDVCPYEDGSFTMVFTLKTRAVSSDYYDMEVTGVWSDEPGFGAITSIAPKESSNVNLPVNVPNHGDNNLSIRIEFPNGTTFVADNIYVPDASGNTITITPESVSRCESSEWNCWASNVFIEQLTSSDVNRHWGDFDVIGGWTLTKISN